MASVMFVHAIHVPFSPLLLLILAFQPILFHLIVAEGQYMLYSIEGFFLKNVEQSCLTVVWQMSCQRSHICWYICMVLTPCSCLSSVCSGSFKIKFCLALPETGVTNFLQEGYHTHQFAENECFVS